MNTPTADAVLLPCPFCGAVAHRIDIDDGENAGGSCIACTRCLASGNVEFEFKENFVSNWNRRATPPAQPGWREEAAKHHDNEAAAWDEEADCRHTDDHVAAAKARAEQHRQFARNLRAVAQPGALDARTVRRCIAEIEGAAVVVGPVRGASGVERVRRVFVERLSTLAHMLEAPRRGRPQPKGEAGADASCANPRCKSWGCAKFDAAPAAQSDAEPVAWEYEYDLTGGSDMPNWSHTYSPNRPDNEPWIRNVQPLYAAPRPASDDARDAGQLLDWLNDNHATVRWFVQTIDVGEGRSRWEVLRYHRAIGAGESAHAAIRAAIAKQAGGGS